MKQNFYDLHTADEYNYLPIIKKYKPYITGYLDRIKRVLDLSICNNMRLSVLRFDLRMPRYYHPDVHYSDQLMPAFFQSLKAQLDNADIRGQRYSGRAHPHRMRYLWVRENNNPDGYHHYHCAIFVNRDRYRSLGDISHAYQHIDRYGTTPNTLLGYIYSAWMRALRLNVHDVRGLVHIPHNHTYRVDQNDCSGFFQAYSEVFYRLSYFAKLRTKNFDDGHRNLGFSIK